MGDNIKNLYRSNERGKPKSKLLYSTSLVSQRQRLLACFKISKKIHRCEADDKYNICHLDAKICNPQKMGYPIITASKLIFDQNDITHLHIAEYVFIGLSGRKSHE